MVHLSRYIWCLAAKYRHKLLSRDIEIDGLSWVTAVATSLHCTMVQFGWLTTIAVTVGRKRKVWKISYYTAKRIMQFLLE